MIGFERMYSAYEDCMVRKTNSSSALQFSFIDLPKEIIVIVNDINNRTYKHSPSSCFGIEYPTAREIYAAQFRDRVVQHFFCQEIEPLLEKVLVDNTTSCREKKGTDYALKLLKEFVEEDSEHGTKPCWYRKIDLSGYFMSIRREYVTEQMIILIETEYHGEYKEELLYLAPIIYMNNPAKDRVMKMSLEVWNKIPERKRMNPNGTTGIAIGNITAQNGSNLNLNAFDHFCMYNLGLPHFVRYVDDVIIVNTDKQKLIDTFPAIEAKLNETGQKINHRKTKIENAYHGIKFLGKITYPYGYQKPSPEAAGRVIKSARELTIDRNVLSKLNSQAGRMKHYASFSLLLDYMDALPDELSSIVYYDLDKQKFGFQEGGKELCMMKEKERS